MNVVSQTQRSLQSRPAMYNGYMPPAGPWALGMPVVPGPVAAQQTPMPQVQLPPRMERHFRGVDDGRQQYKCDFCDYSSTKKENLARHKYLRGHGQGDAQDETHKCQRCDFRSNAVMLREHARSVHGEEVKRHKCHLCQYSSTRKENLTRHQKQHSKGSPGSEVAAPKHFKCELCDYSSSRKDNLRRHQKLRGHVTELSLHEGYKCPWCNFRSNTTVLKQHINKVHSGKMKEYKCDLCYYSSARKDNLTRHKNLRGHVVKGDPTEMVETDFSTG